MARVAAEKIPLHACVHSRWQALQQEAGCGWGVAACRAAALANASVASAPGWHLHPLFVPSPFRNPEQIKAAQDNVLKDFHFDISADGKAVSLNPLERGHACLKHAQDKQTCARLTACLANACACRFCSTPSGISGRAGWPRASASAPRTCAVAQRYLLLQKHLSLLRLRPYRRAQQVSRRRDGDAEQRAALERLRARLTRQGMLSMLLA